MLDPIMKQILKDIGESQYYKNWIQIINMRMEKGDHLERKKNFKF